MTLKTTFFLSLLLASSIAALSKGFRLAPGEPLRTSSTVYEVYGRQGLLIRQRLGFGPYTTPYVKRSAIRRWTAVSGVPGIFSAEHMKGRQSIRFALTNGSDTIEAETVTRVKSTDLIIGDNRNSLPNVVLDVMATGTARQENNFCVSFTQRAGQSWELFLDNTAAQLHRDAPAGFLCSDSMYYTIVPVWQVARKGKVSALPFGAAGLELRDEGGRTRAAVSLIDGGEVHLGEGSKAESLLLSAACAALLLQSDIE